MAEEDKTALEQLEELALAPKRVRTDSGEVEQQDPLKQLEVLKRTAGVKRGSALSRLGFYQISNQGGGQ